MGVKTNQKRKTRPVRFFFWEGQLHKVLRISYPQNLVEAWCFADRKSVALLYTDWKRNSGKALRTHEVQKLLRISRGTIRDTLAAEEIREPQRSYTLNGKFNDWERWWSETDVLELHEALMGHHWGRPRNDGKITPNQNLPTAAEVKAFFRNQETLYIQTQDGRMVPVFEQHRW